MRIGILTFHHSENFGAVFQALSLQSLLVAWGHDVVILNHASHRCPPWTRWRDPQGRIAKPMDRVRGLLHQRSYCSKFRLFRKRHLNLTRLLAEPGGLAEAARSLDAIITGSDQVWHLSREPRYFLQWDPPFSGRKISYAASCGSDFQPEADRKKIGGWIRSFDFISVRDDFSAKLVAEVANRKPQVVADPALLVDPSPWIQIPAYLPSDYFLIYHLGPVPADLPLWMRQTQDQNTAAPWVWINGHADRISKPPPAEFKVWHAAPEEWLGAIQGCRALLTDSFHATLYALQFQRPFLILASDQFRSPRLLDLARRYDLADHVISDLQSSRKPPFLLPSERSRAKLQAHREESWGFLRRALSGH